MLSNHISLNDWNIYLKNYFQSSDGLVMHIPDKFCTILDVDISLKELKASINGCKKDKSPGIDGVANEFYGSIPQNWQLYMLVLFNKIMHDENVPDDWGKMAVTMLYKKGDVKNPENYRPIALVNSITKIFT